MGLCRQAIPNEFMRMSGGCQSNGSGAACTDSVSNGKPSRIHVNVGGCRSNGSGAACIDSVSNGSQSNGSGAAIIDSVSNGNHPEFM